MVTILRRGEVGSRVLDLQKLLRTFGIGVALDGVFGGETEEAIREVQEALGLQVDGVPGPKTLAALEGAIQAQRGGQDPVTRARTLGERCVALAQEELRRGVKANPYGQPNTGLRVREYLAGCLRDLNGDGKVDPNEKLRLTEGNWCAAFQSWLLEQCLAPGEIRPHLYRAGVVEIEADAKRLGLFHPRKEVLSVDWLPMPGDLVLWDRSDPKDPSTTWHRHVNRLVGWDDPGEVFVTIGGNENRTVTQGKYQGGSIHNPKLIGFVSYSQKPVLVPVDEVDRLRLQGLASVATAEIWKGAS